LKALALASSAAVVNGAAHGGYPAEYPFMGPDGTGDPTKFGLPTTLPDLSGSDSDGGYGYSGLVCNYDDFWPLPEDATAPFNPAYSCGTWGFILFKQNLHQYLYYIGNCSSDDGSYFDVTTSHYDGFGEIQGETICSDCCAEYVANGIRTGNDFVGPISAILGDWIVSGGCGTPSNEIFCLYSAGMMAIQCAENYQSATERNNVYPCLDQFVHYLATCKAFSMFGLPNRYEPDAYWETLEPAMTALVFGAVVSGDRVCHPYAYYNPEDTTDSDTTDDTPDDTPAPDDDGNGSGVHFGLFALVVLALAQ